MTSGRLVLLVDDDRDLATALSAVLQQRGFEVVVAADAVSGLRSAVQLRPDAVVLDVGLPGGEGTVVLRRLRALPQLAGVPVVMMSGRDPTKYRDDALAGGAAAYLEKPFDPGDLVAALFTALGEDAPADAVPERPRLGDILKGKGLVTEEQIQTALARQPHLGDLLREMGLVTEQQIAEALAEQQGVRVPAPDASAGVHAGKLVLVVDDDEDLLGVLAAPLRRWGLEVAVATDAITATAAAIKQRPDAVLMDIGLPGGDGLGVMQRLHTLPRLAAVPVIVLSGRDPLEHREKAIAAGAVGYLQKPVHPGALVAAVKDALDGRLGAASPPSGS